MNLLVVSNMYPSAKAPFYGTFVKTFYEYVSRANTGGHTELMTMYGRQNSKWGKILAYTKYYLSLTAKLLTTRADLIYVHTIAYPRPAIRIARLLRPSLPIVYNVHGNDVIPRLKAQRLLMPLAVPELPKARMIVAPSPYFADVVREVFHGIDPDKMAVSPSGGLSPQFYVDRLPVAELPEVPLIGTVTRLDKNKGVDVLLKALASVRERGYRFRAQIAGRGELDESLHALSTSLGMDDCVEFIGPVPHDSLPQKYAQFDLFVVPTMLSESLGLVGLEAMAASCPVIVSDHGGPATYVEHGLDGFKFTRGSDQDLADMICRYLDLSPEQRRQMSMAARRKAEKFRTDTVMEDLWKKIQALV